MWAHVGVAQGHLLLGECGPAADALARADAVGDSPIATSWATRERTRAWLEAGLGDLVAARARLHDVLAVVQRDGVRTFESAVLNDLVRFGRADEAVERLGQLVERGRRTARARPTTATPWPSPTATPTRCSVVVDDYEALDVLALRRRGRRRAGRAAPAARRAPASPRRRCSDPASWRRAPAACAPHHLPWRRGRAADRSRARGGAARRRWAQQPRDRRPAVPVDPHRRDAPRPRRTASWASPPAASWRRRWAPATLRSPTVGTPTPST